MARRGKVAVSITADASGLERGTRRASSSIDRMAKSGENSLRRLKLAAAGAAAGLVVIGKGAIDMASDIAEQTSKIETVLGKGGASKAVEDFAKTAAKSFGISRQEALAATGSFASMFKLIGQSSPAAAKMSVQMTKLAADMASFNNASPKEALDALQAGLRGESEPLRRFNVLLDDATLRQQALAMGLVSTTKNSLTPQQRAMAAYGVILKQTNVQQGDFHRTSKGLANQQRILKAEVSNMQAELGQALLPTMLKAATAARKFIDQIKSGRGAGAQFASAMKAIGSALAPIAKFFYEHPKMIAAALAAWAAYKAAAIAAAVVAVGATGGVAAAFVAASAAGYLFAENWKTIWASTKTAAEGTINWIIDKINAIISAYNALPILKDIDKVGAVDLTAPSEGRGMPKVAALPSLSGPTTASKIMQFLTGRGYTKQAAAGFVGNFMQESGLRPGAEEAGGGGGFGLAQWTGPRRKQLEAFAKRHKASAGDLALQLEFLTTEVASSPGFFSRLQKARTPQEAASIIEREFERPKAGPTANSGGRQQWAAQAFAGNISAKNAKKNAAQSIGYDPVLGDPSISGSSVGTAVKKAVPTGLDKFQAAVELIGLRMSAGGLTSSQAARAIISLANRTLTKKGLSRITQLRIKTARREAEATLRANRRTGAEPDAGDGSPNLGSFLTGFSFLGGEIERQQTESDAARAFRESYGGTGFTAAALAMAQTDTPSNTADDLGIYRGRLALAQSYYGAAKASGNEEDIVHWADEVRSNTQAIADLTAATEDQTAKLQAQLDVQKQMTAEAQRRANTAEAQTPQILKAISDMVSGQIGGDVGLGMMTPSFAGGSARY